MKTIFIYCWLLFILVVIELPSFAQSPPAPTLTCTIEQPLDAPSGTPVTYDVSNISLITMDVAINTQGGQLDGSGNVSINPTGTPLPASYLTITATNSSGTAVPVTATVSGGASGTNTNGYSITMFIPEDSTTRTTKEQARIDSAKTADGGSDAAGLAWMNANNTKALAALDRIYTQSRVGAFTITVTYVSTKSGLWNGTVTSTSIIANVENEGSQLDNIPN